MSYINAEKLIAEINNRLMSVNLEKLGNSGCHRIYAYNDVKDLITSLQPAMDVVSTAKVFLDALSKTPYNNKPITDAQIIVKQLLLFLETPSKYNPDAIVEQPEVDLEKEFNIFLDSVEGAPRMWHSDEQMEWGKDIAKHFLELGISISNEAQKGE